MIKFSNIRKQMALLTLIPLLVLAIGLAFFLLHGRYADLDSGLLERGKLIARQMAASSEYGVFANNHEVLKNIASASLREPDVRGVAILNASGEILFSAGEISAALHDLNTQFRLAQDSATENTTRLARAGLQTKSESDTQVQMTTRGIRLYQPVLTMPVVVDELETRPQAQQIGTVVVEMSQANTETRKQKMLIATVLGTALFLLIVLYLVYRASLDITQPISQMSESVQRIAQGQLNTKTEVRSEVFELHTLARGLDEMAGQLQQDRQVLEQRITEATQALREKKDEAELASRNKSHFLAVASHDLRQPLHALGLYVVELRRQLAATPQQGLVGKVEQSVDALGNLLNTLLDISKLDAGAISPQRQNFPIAHLINRIVADFQMLADSKQIQLRVRLLPDMVDSDPVLVERVLVNLLNNAIRYTAPHGRVMIVCRKRDTQLRIEVRDNGIGISPTHQKNIFDEFFQVSKSQMDNNKGLGLGLAIVDRLCKLLGHPLALRSLPGRGSVFAVSLPLGSTTAWLADMQPEYAAVNVHEGALPLLAKNILVVDDDAAILASTAHTLASWGGEIRTAFSLQNALQQIADGWHCDLIVSDYQLSANETGMDVIRQVREQQANQTAAILITGDTSSELAQRAREAGYLLMHKPVRPARLRSLITFALESSAHA